MAATGGECQSPGHPTFSPASDWRARAAAHRRRAREWTGPMRDRKARREPHPVLDFLHTYYSFSFAKLEQWHPGIGVVLEDAADLPAVFRKRPYRAGAGGIALDVRQLGAARRNQFGWIQTLLANTQQRPPNLACHGMHEWAMVYGGAQIRHRESVPLRLSPSEIDAVIDAHPLCCTHYDAFRFFAPATRPRNRFRPDLADREHHEQPACIHANMDLYKWASKAMPWIGSDLLWDCFLLATRCRTIDMRASPYDLRHLGYPPIPIETETGRRHYEREQAALMESGRPLRERLLAAIGTVLGCAQAADGASPHGPAAPQVEEPNQ